MTSPVEKALLALKNRQPIILIDDEDRENEGDIVFIGESATAEIVNFTVREGRGLLCLALAPEIVDRLQLPLMIDAFKNTDQRSTAFTLSIEARLGVSTGISAADRATTIRVASDPHSTPSDIVVPGHIFPLRSRKGGVLERAGHTEGAVDLARLAGFNGAAAICEIMNDDGTMARGPDLKRFADKHKLEILTIPDLIAHRLQFESLVEEVDRHLLSLLGGKIQVEAILFRSKIDNSYHVALTKGLSELSDQTIVDVRVLSQKPLIDVFGALSNPNLDRIQEIFDIMGNQETFAFVYLNSDQGPTNWMNDYLQITQQKDLTRPRSMDSRQIGLGAQILRSLGIRRMRVHSQNPHQYKGLSGFGLEVIN